MTGMHQAVEAPEDEISEVEEIANEFIEVAYMAYLEGVDPHDLYQALTATAKVALMFECKGGTH